MIAIPLTIGLLFGMPVAIELATGNDVEILGIKIIKNPWR